ncbi:MAG: SLBB domain-containing protein [Candidatus Marinimicrobia bacterium]|nr:SLBB domain-containing protein [Candidatus Neomarinimicrobiota bacterium]
MKNNFTRFILTQLALILLFLLVNTVQIQAQRRATTEMDRVRIEMNKERQKRLADRKEKMQERMKELLDQVLDGALNPKEYIVGPGDLFSINIWGSVNEQYEAIVSPVGNLEVPTVGSVYISGLTLEAAINKILRFSKKIYSDVDVSVSLEQLRLFRVYLTGNVSLPGTYKARAVDRIADIIDMAHGLDGLADGTNITVTSSSGVVKTFDYLEYINKGVTDNNIRLSNGDVINVPTLDLSGSVVTIESYDSRSGSFYLKDNEYLSDLLVRTGVYSRLSDMSSVYVRRGSGENNRIIQVGRSLSEMKNFRPLPGDRIIIPLFNEMVYITGEVAHPGAYPYIPDMTAEDYLGYAGGPRDSGKGNKVKVIRDGSVVKGNSKIIVQRGDNVMVPRKLSRSFRDMYNIILPITSLILSAKAAGIF